jgi:hypothetical protein
LAALRALNEQSQAGGGCRLNAGSGRCNKYEGVDTDDCLQGKARCQFAKGAKKPMLVKKERTPAQRANDVLFGQRSKERAARLAALRALNEQSQAGGASKGDV